MIIVRYGTETGTVIFCTRSARTRKLTSYCEFLMVRGEKSELRNLPPQLFIDVFVSMPTSVSVAQDFSTVPLIF